MIPMIFTIAFKVREQLEQAQAGRQQQIQVLVDMIVDIKLKLPFFPLAPLLKAVLGKKLGGFVEGISNLRE